MKIPKFNMIVTTVLIILVVGLSAYYFRPVVGVPEGEIGLEIGVPAQHSLYTGQDIIPLPVVLRLRNRTQAEVGLKVSTPCRVFRYVVTTLDGGFIQAIPDTEICAQSVSESFIRAQENIEELRQVPLVASRYAPGAYQLHVKFWNYTAIAPFELVSNN
jgi:hypothetical protein